ADARIDTLFELQDACFCGPQAKLMIAAGLCGWDVPE
ncbi:MAG: hypothetical protein ACI8Z0_002233, partial [Lentimonas sp.]